MIIMIMILPINRNRQNTALEQNELKNKHLSMSTKYFELFGEMNEDDWGKRREKKRERQLRILSTKTFRD